MLSLDDVDSYQLDYGAIEYTRSFAIIIGTFSSLFPLSVVILLTMKYNRLVRGKRLIGYVFNIAIADTIISLSIAMGYPTPNTITCSVQAFLINFFSRTTWFFTDVLIFQLFEVIVFKKYFLKVRYINLIIWSLNIILQCLPWSTKTAYGQDDDGRGIGVFSCELSIGAGTPQWTDRWIFYTYQLELLTSFAFILFFTLYILIYCYQKSKDDSNYSYIPAKVRSSWSTVILYPVGKALYFKVPYSHHLLLLSLLLSAMMVTYVPSTIYAHYLDVYAANHTVHAPHHAYVIYNILQMSNVLYGVALTFIFYSKTGALAEWKYIIREICCPNSLDDIDKNDSRESIESIATVDDQGSIAMKSIEDNMNPISNEIHKRIEDV